MRTLLKQCAAFFVLSCSLSFTTGASAQTPTEPSAEIEQLVAPIALYPDPLVAQILSAATYPTEVVQAWQWEQQHPGAQGQQLADWVDSQPWDQSVKALTQFPSVLDSMNANLTWTSALGDAYANEPDAVLQAVQVMRQRAQSAGALYSTNQQTVTADDQSISIEPVDPQVVYVPQYDPWLVYGDPLATYPGWVGVPGVFYDGPDLYFGLGFGVGLLAGAGWGWGHWGVDWHERRALHDHAAYIPRGPTFAMHHDRGGPAFDHRPGDSGGRVLAPRSSGRSPDIGEGPRGQMHAVASTSAFSGFNHGGVVSGYSARGRSSFGEGVHTAGLPVSGFHEGGFAGAHGTGGFAGGGAHMAGGFAGGGARMGGGFAGGGAHMGGGFAGGGAHMGGGFAGGGGHGGGGHR
jgi:hypothetical protein